MKEHPIDRAMRAARPAILVFAVIAAPVMLFTYAWGLRLLFDVIGVGWFLVVGLCHAIGWIGISAQIDMTRERRQQPPSER